MDTLLGWLHAMAWAVYVGGALTMEWVLRYAQREMPGPQVGVVCKNAGMRYRWLALACLAVIGVTGAWMLLRLDEAHLLARPGAPMLSLSDSYGRTVLLLAATWGLLLATVAFMAFVLHPAQRKRSKPEMTKDEVAAERQRVGRAISRMDKALKFELLLAVVSVGIGASLHAGGLI
ncbi:MAG: CopD family protein [Gemmatimonadales bacterium]|nr:CopD family protein [Gemmatimonadales bacterium]